MQTILVRALAFLALLSIPATAAPPTPPIFVPASGLQLSLDTGGYKFFVGDPTTPVAAARARVARLGGLLPTGTGFNARAVLGNSSLSALAFQFPDAGSAEVKFKFSVLDAAGTLVWQSDTDTVSAQVITPATLGPGVRWKRVIQIPLKVNGAWLAPGLYTLEATLAATPAVSASTIFEVANLPEVPPANTGISGQVLAARATGDPIPAKASVSIVESRLPNARYDHPAFVWWGTTDDAGNFKVATPPGSFFVTAVPLRSIQVSLGANLLSSGAQSRPSPAATATGTLIVAGSVSKTVSVVTGSFTDVSLTLPNSTPPPPPVGTGVSGTVLSGPVAPVAQVGVPNETPLAGAVVTISEYQIPGVYYFRGPWTWTTTTDANGKFQQAVPAGRYLVTAHPPFIATLNNAAIILRPIGWASQVVDVVDGQFTDVTLHLDTGIRFPFPIPLPHPLPL